MKTGNEMNGWEIWLEYIYYWNKYFEGVDYL